MQSIESDREAIYHLNNTASNLSRPTVGSILSSNAYVQYREYLRKSQIMPPLKMKLIESLKQIFIVHFKLRGWSNTTLHANP